jgi:hypothetical protein
MNTLKFNQIEFNHVGKQPTSSIKLQEKNVIITENGTIEVVPDSGYALEKVNVETKITNDPNSDNYIEYFNVDDLPDTHIVDSLTLKMLILQNAKLIRTKIDAFNAFYRNDSSLDETIEISAVSFMPNEKLTIRYVSLENNDIITNFQWTITEYLSYYNMLEEYKAIPRIKKTLFYSIK